MHCVVAAFANRVWHLPSESCPEGQLVGRGVQVSRELYTPVDSTPWNVLYWTAAFTFIGPPIPVVPSGWVQRASGKDSSGNDTVPNSLATSCQTTWRIPSGSACLPLSLSSAS